MAAGSDEEEGRPAARRCGASQERQQLGESRNLITLWCETHRVLPGKGIHRFYHHVMGCFHKLAMWDGGWFTLLYEIWPQGNLSRKNWTPEKCVVSGNEQWYLHLIHTHSYSILNRCIAYAYTSYTCLCLCLCRCLCLCLCLCLCVGICMCIFVCKCPCICTCTWFIPLYIIFYHIIS